MSKTIQGIYKNGKIELANIPQGITESQVLVTFRTSSPPRQPSPLWFLECSRAFSNPQKQISKKQSLTATLTMPSIGNDFSAP